MGDDERVRRLTYDREAGQENRITAPIDIKGLDATMERLQRAVESVQAAFEERSDVAVALDTRLSDVQKELRAAFSEAVSALRKNGGPGEIDSMFADIQSAIETETRMRKSVPQITIETGKAHVDVSEMSVFVSAARHTLTGLKGVYPSQLSEARKPSRR